MGIPNYNKFHNMICEVLVLNIAYFYNICLNGRFLIDLSAAILSFGIQSYEDEMIKPCVKTLLDVIPFNR